MNSQHAEANSGISTPERMRARQRAGRFITFAVQQAKEAQAFGFTRNECCRNLKIAIHQYWQNKVLGHHGQAHKKRIPRSKAALSKADSDCVVEHVIPQMELVTRNKDLAALKGVARAAWELRQIDTDELLRIRSIKGDCGSGELAGRYVPLGEMSSLFLACSRDASPAGLRDAAMLAVAMTTGARRAEIAGMRLENLTHIPDESRYEVRIVGKRNKERRVFVAGNTARALADWLVVRIAPGCNFIGPIFCAIRKGGAVLHDAPLSTTALDKLLLKRAREASVAAVNWHDFRRSTASNLLDAGADISTVAGILGHSNVQTTSLYDTFATSLTPSHACLNLNWPDATPSIQSGDGIESRRASTCNWRKFIGSSPQIIRLPW